MKAWGGIIGCMEQNLQPASGLWILSGIKEWLTPSWKTTEGVRSQGEIQPYKAWSYASELHSSVGDRNTLKKFKQRNDMVRLRA